MQTSTQLDLFVVGTNGALYGFVKNGAAAWSGAVLILANFAPSGAALATGKQGTNQLDVFAVGSDGTVKVTWVVGAFGFWHLPLALTGAGVASPGSHVATGRQEALNQLDVFYMTTTGAIYANAVVGTLFWSLPFAVTGTNFAVAQSTLSTYQVGTNSLELYVVDNAGALQALSVAGNGGPFSTLTLTRPGVALPRADTTVATQGTNQRDLFLAANSGEFIAWNSGGGWTQAVAIDP